MQKAYLSDEFSDINALLEICIRPVIKMCCIDL